MQVQDKFVGSLFEFFNRIQISKINDCTLEKTGLLPHEFVHGSCGTYEFPEERVMFCFGINNSGNEVGTSAKRCFR